LVVADERTPATVERLRETGDPACQALTVRRPGQGRQRLGQNAYRPL